jgi:anthranilate synthase component 1
VAPAAPVIQPLAAAPDLLALHAADPQRFFCLLNSGAHAERTGRYDILFAEPRRLGSAAAGTPEADALLARLDAYSLHAAPGMPSELPFVGGCVFHIGYEVAACFEPKLRLPRPGPEALPDITVWAVDQAIVLDATCGKAWCVALDQATATALAREAERPRTVVRPYAEGLASSEAEAPQRYRDGVAAVLDYLLAGDAFQVNLSRGWRLRLAESASGAALHAAMRLHNAAPFSALLHQDGASLVSASPERLVRVVDGVVETRPIAGTRRRGRDADEDAALCGELSRNPKERAEHVMLIDLERNDLGRICRPGSVCVDELLALEHYASVHHLVSNIRGELSPDVGAARVLRAVFPGGTITGCPKVRVMEIIAELETVGRGSYTGSLGYVSRNGRMDSSILIRSLLARDDELVFRAGAGIVADSDPDAELAETEAKARGLLAGLGA